MSMTYLPQCWQGPFYVAPMPVTSLSIANKVLFCCSNANDIPVPMLTRHFFCCTTIQRTSLSQWQQAPFSCFARTTSKQLFVNFIAPMPMNSCPNADMVIFCCSNADDLPVPMLTRTFLVAWQHKWPPWPNNDKHTLFCVLQGQQAHNLILLFFVAPTPTTYLPQCWQWHFFVTPMPMTSLCWCWQGPFLLCNMQKIYLFQQWQAPFLFCKDNKQTPFLLFFVAPTPTNYLPQHWQGPFLLLQCQQPPCPDANKDLSVAW